MNNLKRKFAFDYDTPLNSSPNETGTPERNLLTAILERAILDFVGNDSKQVEHAEKWLFAPQNSNDFRPFSFEWVCERLDLNAKSIEENIRKMPKRGTNRVAPWYFMKNKDL